MERGGGIAEERGATTPDAEVTMTMPVAAEAEGACDAGNGHGEVASAWAKSGFQKRIDKLVRQRHEQEARVENLQAQIVERDHKIAGLLAELELMCEWKRVALKLRRVLNKRRGQQHG